MLKLVWLGGQTIGGKVENTKEIDGTRVDVANASIEVSQDSKNLGLLIWGLTLLFGFVPGLIFYLIKKDDQYVMDQSKEALNWAITALIGYVAAAILTFILIGILVFFALGICHLVFCIMGVIAASKGELFRVPFAIRLVK